MLTLLCSRRHKNTGNKIIKTITSFSLWITYPAPIFNIITIKVPKCNYDNPKKIQAPKLLTLSHMTQMIMKINLAQSSAFDKIVNDCWKYQVELGENRKNTDDFTTPNLPRIAETLSLSYYNWNASTENFLPQLNWLSGPRYCDTTKFSCDLNWGKYGCHWNNMDSGKGKFGYTKSV